MEYSFTALPLGCLGFLTWSWSHCLGMLLLLHSHYHQNLMICMELWHLQDAFILELSHNLHINPGDHSCSDCFAQLSTIFSPPCFPLHQRPGVLGTRFPRILTSSWQVFYFCKSNSRGACVGVCGSGEQACRFSSRRRLIRNDASSIWASSCESPPLPLHFLTS